MTTATASLFPRAQQDGLPTDLLARLALAAPSGV